MNSVLFLKLQLSQLALTMEDIAFATENDRKLKKLYKGLLVDSDKCGGFWLYEKCIIFGTRIWIPKALQNYVLEYLHIEHVGAIKMMALALSYCVYWPSIDEDIVNLASNCLRCIEIQLAPMKKIAHKWVVSKAPWERIYIDYAGPFMDNLFLLVVDEFSMWPEVFISNSSSASNTIEKLKLLFSKFGQPEVLVSDNITSFMEEKFQTFLESFGIEHCTDVPHNVASYDSVVRFVFTLKHALIELKGQVSSVQDQLNTLLCTCRRSQITSSKESPAKLFLGRELRSNLDPSKPMEKTQNKIDTIIPQLLYYGQKVAVYNNVNGFIISLDAPNYLTVMVNGRLIRRHIDKVIPFPIIKSVSNIQSISYIQPVQSKRLKRIIKPKIRLNL